MDQVSAKTTPDWTTDAIYEGRLVLRQSQKGYRFSVDAPLLTRFACLGKPAAHCVDLGAGCGVVGLGILAAGGARRLTSVEVQEGLASFCMFNARNNNLDGAFNLVASDMRSADERLVAGSFDLVVSNPPFWPVQSSRLPDEEERRIACHEVMIDLDGLVEIAAKLLQPRRGRLCVVFPARRLDDLLIALSRIGLGAVKLQAVHPIPGEPAQVVLVEARHGRPGSLDLVAPIILKEADGTDSGDAVEMLSGRFSDSLRARKDRRTA